MKPYQLPHPPIGVAGVSENSDTMLQAGDRGWIPMSINLVPGRILKTHWDSVEEGAKKTGRNPDRSTWRIAREIYVADTSEQARKEALEGVLARDFNQYFRKLLPQVKHLDLVKKDPNMPDSDVTAEYMADNVWIVGSPDEVAEKLQALSDEVGGFGVLLAMGHEWQPKEQWLHSTELLINEVIPKLS
jgi:alkanesulfonate monooxygenase SsuD/methylene tetrahydromethanopterin reductase-like flavin-dependent oxidoreductase (luciferase family)